METSNFRVLLTETVHDDIQNQLVSSIATGLNDNGTNDLSPPISADDTGAPNTGCSTGDGSVFTFNTVTDESADERKSKPSSPATFEEEIVSASTDNKEQGDGKKVVDKNIKMVLHQEYTHVVKYDYQTLLMKLKEIEEAEKSSVNKENETSSSKFDKPSDCRTSGSTPGSNEAVPLKEKFSSRVLKNIMSAFSSPIMERKPVKCPLWGRSGKKSNSTSSPSLAKRDGSNEKGSSSDKGSSKNGGKSSKKKLSQASMPKIQQDGPTI